MTSRSLTFAALALAAIALPAQANISLNPLSAPTAGSFFDVVVKLTGVFNAHPGDSVAAFGFNVFVGDPSVVSYTGETVGSLFDDFSGVFGASPQVVGIATSGFLAAGDFTEPLTLATLHFQALATGPTTIGIQTDLTDPNQGLFYSAAGADPLNATTSMNVAVTPEPRLMLLAGLGLGLLILICRRQHRKV